MATKEKINVITRTQYMNKEFTHDEYWGQFVTNGVMLIVKRVIGESDIKNSKCKYFNNIRPKVWDRLSNITPNLIDLNLWRDANGWDCSKTYPWSLDANICIAKAAARMIREGEMPS